VIPENWPGFELTFRFGRTEYRIEVANGGERSSQEIELVDDGGRHAVKIYTGAPALRHLAAAADPPTAAD
jgi:hypothetical protein